MINGNKRTQLLAGICSVLRPSSLRFMVVLAFLIGICGCVAQFAAEKPEHVDVESLDEEHESAGAEVVRMSREQLREEIERFTFRYYGRLNPILDEFLDVAFTPEQRLRIHKWKSQIAYSLVDITIEENPEISLLDMLVLVTLVRAVSEERLVPQVFPGDIGQKWLVVVRLSENEIWSTAEKVLDPEQQKTLREKINAWHANNPDMENVATARFSDFAAEVGADESESLPQPGGLLPEVSEATRAVDEIRRVTERAMFLATVSPGMARLEAEGLIYRLATQPEAKEYRASLENFSNAAKKLAAASDQLPILIASERQAAVDQAMDRLFAERETLFAEIDARSNQLKEILGQIQDIATTGDNLTGEVAASMTALDTLVTRLGLDNMEKPFNIEDYRNTLVEATVTAGEINRIVTSLERLLYAGLNEENRQSVAVTLLELEDHVERWIWLLFAALAGLVLFTAVVTVGASLVHRKLTDRAGKTA